MAAIYIPRTLLMNKGESKERTVSEDEVASLTPPLIILGDPGLGKTRLSESLSEKLSGRRMTAGTFCRNEDPNPKALAPGELLIIDGLDEIASATGGVGVDEVLRKLSRIGKPRFILSCRSADWQGSTDRHKIDQDYGAEPIALHLQPFSIAEATRFLSSYDDGINSEEVLNELDGRDLGELYGNPLTLTLLAELAKEGTGLPKSRAELFDRACELLLREANRGHQRSTPATSSLDNLLDSAGAIFVHLLLSGSLGVADRPRQDVPAGFVPLTEFDGIPRAPQANAVIRTRLFTSVGENLFIPLHRMIAEYLGARWLVRRLSDGLSERRALQALTSANGVPTTLRGLHAWLAHFKPALADRCIRTDPYGVLRYGEPGLLPESRARQLLSSLAALAEEDPYFRSEDWGRHSVAGLARPELRDEILNILKNPNRHIHLSTVVLEALAGSSLTELIASDLLALVKDRSAGYVERFNAAEALISSHIHIDWAGLLVDLKTAEELSSSRLRLDIIKQTRGRGIPGDQIVDAIVDHEGLSRSDQDDDYVLGVTWRLPKQLAPLLAAEVLDSIGSRLAAAEKPPGWAVSRDLLTTIQRLVARVLDEEALATAQRLWSWIRFLEDGRSQHLQEAQQIADFLKAHTNLRREIQAIAIAGADINYTISDVISHVLPSVSDGLALTVEDTVELLGEIASKESLSSLDIELWIALIRTRLTMDDDNDVVRHAAGEVVQHHPELESRWQQLTHPSDAPWRRDHEEREAARRESRQRRFDQHRASFQPHRDAIALGETLGALHGMANAYLGRFVDLENDSEPVERLRSWLGDDLTAAALTGFVAFLSRPDLPSVETIGAAHAENREFHAETIMICGIAEMVRSGRSLDDLRPEVAKAALASWWEHLGLNSDRLSDSIPSELERRVFSSDGAIEDFLVAVLEPRIRTGHEHVPGLHRLQREDRFKYAAPKVVLRWLNAYPNAKPGVQRELLETALRLTPIQDLKPVVLNRVSEPAAMEDWQRELWIPAAFLLDLEECRATIESFCDEDANRLWAIRAIIRPDRNGSRPWPKLSAQQLAFVVRKFAAHWPPNARPRSGFGDTDPYSAQMLIGSCIDAIGASETDDALAVLDDLAAEPRAASYHERIKHVRAQHRRAKRDREFRVPSFVEIKQTLCGGPPANVDDLKALILDHLEMVQEYIRNGDTQGWRPFWEDGKPKDENSCRDLLLDSLRFRILQEINLLPETLMPEKKRVDIVAIVRGQGLPIEIKGQWHDEVWDAASTQLDERYTRDWRARGRGIYLVLWFGNVPGKNLPKHPEARMPPTSPFELRQMLLERLSDSEKSRIDVFVLDLSTPAPTES